MTPAAPTPPESTPDETSAESRRGLTEPFELFEGLTPSQRRTAARHEREELNVLHQVVCRLWDSGVWEDRWDAWLDYWNANRLNWLGPRRAFGGWLRQRVAEDMAPTPAERQALDYAIRNYYTPPHHVAALEALLARLGSTA